MSATDTDAVKGPRVMAETFMEIFTELHNAAQLDVLGSSERPRP